MTIPPFRRVPREGPEAAPYDAAYRYAHLKDSDEKKWAKFANAYVEKYAGQITVQEAWKREYSS